MGLSQQRCKMRAKSVQNQPYESLGKYIVLEFNLNTLKNVQKHNGLEKSQEQTVHWKSGTSHDKKLTNIVSDHI